MIARTEWRFRQTVDLKQRRSTERPSWNSHWLIRGLTAVFVVWLLYRWLGRPDWIDRLPALLAEMVRLAEMGWVGTLALLWGVVWWRGQRDTADSPIALTLDDLYELTPAEFERYVAGLFRRKGYRVQVRGRSGDLGVDLMLTQRGGRRAIVQCKRYRNTIGPEIVRELFGTLIHERVAYAFLVTTADISDSAREWAQGKPMTLIDGPTLIHIAASLSASRAKDA